MNKKEAVVGALAVVNDLEDTPIYRIKRVTGFIAELEYLSGGQMVKGGDGIDIDCLKVPSWKQLEYFVKEKMDMEVIENELQDSPT